CARNPPGHYSNYYAMDYW
nr:immunoglobulin heavy chain junction region [Mus musculus]MBK4186019.1 immunoglobulin heavy chain junction region [Mus musculus]